MAACIPPSARPVVIVRSGSYTLRHGAFMFVELVEPISAMPETFPQQYPWEKPRIKPTGSLVRTGFCNRLPAIPPLGAVIYRYQVLGTHRASVSVPLNPVWQRQRKPCDFLTNRCASVRSLKVTVHIIGA